MNHGYIRNSPRVGDTYKGAGGCLTTVKEIIGDRVSYVMNTGVKGTLPIAAWPEAIKHARLIHTADGPVPDEP